MKGVPFVNRRYTKSVTFLSRMLYRRVGYGPRGEASHIKILLSLTFALQTFIYNKYSNNLQKILKNSSFQELQDEWLIFKIEWHLTRFSRKSAKYNQKPITETHFWYNTDKAFNCNPPLIVSISFVFLLQWNPVIRTKRGRGHAKVC